MKEHSEPNAPVITGKWLLSRLEHKLGEFCSSYTLEDLQDMYDSLLEAAIVSDTSVIVVPTVCSIRNDIRYAIGLAAWNQMYDSAYGHSFCSGNEMCLEKAATLEIPLQLQRTIIEALETLVPEDFPQERAHSCIANCRSTFLPSRRAQCRQQQREWRPK